MFNLLKLCLIGLVLMAGFRPDRRPAGHKLLIFNRACLVYLNKKSGTLPYFAMWVENAAVMVTGN